MDKNYDIQYYLTNFIRDPNDLEKYCSTNRVINELCKKNRKVIAKHFLKKYDVNYENLNDFIYLYKEEKNIEDYIIDNTFDYWKIFKLYTLYFYDEDIILEDERISSIPILPNAKKINIGMTNIKSIHLSGNLEKFTADGNVNFEKFTINKNNNLITLSCDDTNIKNIPKLSKLKELSISGTPLNSFPDAPNLEKLFCRNTLISDTIPYENLKVLVCGESSITNIPKFKYIEHIDVAGLDIETLPEFPNAKFVDISNTRIKFFHIGKKLTDFNANDTEIEQITADDDNSLEELSIINTPRLTTIPDNLNKIVQIQCSDSSIKTIPYYKTLVSLTCNNTNIIELPQMETLKRLDCSNTKISTLPYFPKLLNLDCSNTGIRQILKYHKLVELRCTDNHLTEIPVFKKLKRLDIRNNDIKFLPKFKKIKSIYIDGNKALERILKYFRKGIIGNMEEECSMVLGRI